VPELVAAESPDGEPEAAEWLAVLPVAAQALDVVPRVAEPQRAVRVPEPETAE